MYFRRHCYDKPHRCPGRQGGGFRYPRDPKGTPAPDWWQEDHPSEDWDKSWLVQQHWWQQTTRCESGLLKMMAGDPWRSLRWHRCTECDVVAIPIVLHWLDPEWIWIMKIDRFFRYTLDDLLDHKRRWTVNSKVPWWSFPDHLWREARSSIRDRRILTKGWFEDLYIWYRYPSQREKSY